MSQKENAYMITNKELPHWLDELIFKQLGAKYCRSNRDMTVIDWDKNDVLNYLGTYFPRSYAEAYCIFFNTLSPLQNFCPRCGATGYWLEEWFFKTEISVFDFGCGTGGEIIGMLDALDALKEFKPGIRKVNIVAFDGNQHALRLFEKIIKAYSEKSNIDICYNVLPFEIDDFYDLSILDSVITQKFDVVMTFKAICEFVTKDRFEKQNAYKHFAQCFLPKLTDDGIMLITDVTSYNNVSQEWLPKMMDSGLAEWSCNVVGQNTGYNQAFYVSHSQFRNDVSKIAYRIINNDFVL